MIFQISRNVFYKALSNVSRAIAINSPLPQLSGIKINVSNESVILTASDNDFSIEHTIDVTDEQNKLVINSTGSIVIDAKYLVDIVRKLETDIVRVELVDGSLVKIYDSKSDFQINGLRANQYPLIDFSEPELSFEMRADEFIKIVSQTIIATSDKETRPVLTGVNFNYHSDHQELVVIATDSYRLAHKKVHLEGVDDSFNITIPRKVLNELTKLLESEKEVKIALNEKKIQFIFDDSLIQSRLLDGSFPETKRLIPTNFMSEFTMSTRELLSALDRASTYKQESGISTVKLSIDNNTVTLSNASQEIGSFKEPLRVNNQKGDPLKISFSARYVSDALRSLSSSDVNIRFEGEMRPFVLKDPLDESILHLVLPVRSYD